MWRARLACCQGKLRHLGSIKGPNKSILSYANQNRPAGLFEDLFWIMLQRFRTNSGLAEERKNPFPKQTS